MKRSSRNVLYVFFGLICVALVAQMLTAVSGAALSSRSSSPSSPPPSSSSSVGAASGGVAVSTSADLSDTCTAWSSNESSFNLAPIAEGNVIWFNSAIRVNGLGSDPASIFLNDSTITFAANGKIYNLAVPGATITFDPAATAATTGFDDAGNRWKTTVPSGLSGRAFLSGLAFRVPDGGLPGGVGAVTWSAAFSTDTPGVTAQWQWAAAVYNTFGPDYNALAVKPVDGDQTSQSANLVARSGNPDNQAGQNLGSAGKPANLEALLTAGASGGGGSNFTGSFFGMSDVTPCAAGSSDQPRSISQTVTTLARRGSSRTPITLTPRSDAGTGRHSLLAPLICPAPGTPGLCDPAVGCTVGLAISKTCPAIEPPLTRSIASSRFRTRTQSFASSASPS